MSTKPNTDGPSVPSKGTLITHLFDEVQSARETGVNPNPLDESENFQALCEAVRKGDLQVVQYLISFGNVNLNAVDRFDYPPLTLASLCGHYEVCKLLLENGAVCERNFQGERTLYNALNDRIKNLLLRYDYTKASDPLDPWAQHISSLLDPSTLLTTDLTITCPASELSPTIRSFPAHKFLLSARSPYFARKLAPPTDEPKKHIRTFQLPRTTAPGAFVAVLHHIYLFEPTDPSEDTLQKIIKLADHYDIPDVLDATLTTDPKQRRAARKASVQKAHSDLTRFFDTFITPHDGEVGSHSIPQHNPAHADIALRAGDIVFPAHRAVLTRADYFATMLNGRFAESRRPGPNEPLPVVHMEDIEPETLRLILRHLYLEILEIPVEEAVELLYAADSLLLDRLKTMCAQTIVAAEAELPCSIYDVIRAGWNTRVRKLEEFGARYIADRLELYLGEEEFRELVSESAERIEGRQETDTIEVVDDVRYYLQGRFRRRAEERFEDVQKLLPDGEEEDEGDDDEGGGDERLHEGLLEGIDTLLEGLTLDA